MESLPQNPEFRNNPENFHLCLTSACAYLWKTSCGDMASLISGFCFSSLPS